MNIQNILLIALVITIPLVIVTQPTLARKSDIDKPIYANAENLKEHVYTIVEKFPNRSYKNLTALEQTARYIHDHFAAYSSEVKYETFKVKNVNDDNYTTYTNVVATFQGTQGKEDEYIIVGGHYDTFAGYPGANDNTSAVASLLELARLLAMHPPKSNVQLVAYCLEEPPFFGTDKMGSFKHAQNLKLAGKNVALAIIMDMIGAYSDKVGSQHYPIPGMEFLYPDKANYISVVANLSWENILSTRMVKKSLIQNNDLPVYSMNAPSIIPGIDFSDHRNYWKFDFPAVLITDTAFYRTKNYHTPDDTPDTLNYDNMAKLTESVHKILQEI